MDHVQRLRTATFALIGALLVSVAARAEDDAAADPPDRVARVSFVQGAVSLQPADAQDWIDATLNRPLTTGDRIWADSASRAELQAGTATIRIDENSGFSFTDLDADVLQVRLTDGAMTLHVYSLDGNETVEIDTPNATVMIRQPGEYAIDTEEDGDRTIVKTRAGEAEVTGADQHGYIVRTNEQGVFSGNEELSSVMTQVARRSAFETWAYERENMQSQSVASRYVAPGVVGYQDLDRNGTWAYEPEYGNVWQPTTYVINDWAPYRYGRWVWVTPWGWTWIDDAPWGFAPFHYGRWAYLRHRWCWVPGPVHGRPTYAPALVAWVGPPSFGVDFRNPNVGWFPLGPREIYLPGSRTSWRYFHSVNSTNAAFADTTELSNAYNGRGQHRDYRNRTAPNAVTVVDREAFVGAHRTLGKRKDVDADDLQHWRDQATPPPIEPSRESRLGAQPSTRVPPQHDRQQDRSERVAQQPTVRPPLVQPPLAQQPTVQPRSLPAAPTHAPRSDSPRQWSGSNVGEGSNRYERRPVTPTPGDADSLADDSRDAGQPDTPATPTVIRPPNRNAAPSHAQRNRSRDAQPNDVPPAPAESPVAQQQTRQHHDQQQADRQPQNDRPPQEQRASRHDRPEQAPDAGQPAARPMRPMPSDPPHHNDRIQIPQPPAQVEQPRVVQQQQAAHEPRQQPQARTEQAPQGAANNRTMAPSVRGQERASPGRAATTREGQPGSANGAATP
jgi:hypothetical protein